MVGPGNIDLKNPVPVHVIFHLEFNPSGGTCHRSGKSLHRKMTLGTLLALHKIQTGHAGQLISIESRKGAGNHSCVIWQPGKQKIDPCSLRPVLKKWSSGVALGSSAA
jgi:hypothetical protein